MDYRIKIHTGPNSQGIKELADKLRDATLREVIEGTECVTFKLGAFDQAEAVMFAEDLIKEIFGPSTPLARGIKAYRSL